MLPTVVIATGTSGNQVLLNICVKLFLFTLSITLSSRFQTMWLSSEMLRYRGHTERIPLLTPMWKDARHVWCIACMCLLHPTLASFNSWLRIIGVAAPYHRVGQYVTFKFQYTKRRAAAPACSSLYTDTMAYLYTDYIAQASS